jgi:hypothetical protein
MLKRHDEAIQVYSNALQLVQSCAEASSIQAQVNEYRHAFDPPPTKEEMLKLIQDPDRELHDKPEPAIALLGFACTPTPANSFNALVEEKWGLFNARGDSYLAMGNKWAALRDMQYAVAISGLLRKFSSVSLCALEIDLRLAASAVEDCRYAYDFNSYSLLGDPVQSAKIGRFLLEDGDLKGACRIAFPFFADESMSAYLNNPEIKALQERVKDALQGAGLTTCEIDYAAWLPKPK